MTDRPCSSRKAGGGPLGKEPYVLSSSAVRSRSKAYRTSGSSFGQASNRRRVADKLTRPFPLSWSDDGSRLVIGGGQLRISAKPASRDRKVRATVGSRWRQGS